MSYINPVLLSDARIAAAYAIFLGSYFVFALGNFPWMKIDRPGAAIIGAVLLVAFRIVGAHEALQSIDFATIVLLFSMMVVVANLRVGGFFERIAEWIAGAHRAGLTAKLLEPVGSWALHRLPSFVPVTAILSNIVSNVPAVMLLRTLVGTFPDPHTGWLALAMSSTLAGNLTITGSIANIIVVERAAAEGVDLSFGEYFRIGLPLTVASLALGTAWLWITTS
jgi:Na+/H+ antiporter NhaD/arsenite permease-like protein